MKSEEAPVKCFIPKRQIHEWKGHTKSIACIKWFPKSAHLLLSGAMDNQVKLWEVYKNRRCIMTYKGHKQAIKDCDFNNSGDHFLSTSYDRSGHLLIFYLFPFCKKSLICLEGKSMIPRRGMTFLFRSSQKLPCLRLGPLKGFLS